MALVADDWVALTDLDAVGSEPLWPLRPTEVVSIHRHIVMRELNAATIAHALESLFRRRGIPVSALGDVHVVGGVTPAMVRLAAESMCYPWRGRIFDHGWRLPDSVVEELSRPSTTPRRSKVTVVLRCLSEILFFAVAEPIGPHRVDADSFAHEPYVSVSMQSGRLSDAFSLQRQLWDRDFAPDVLVVSPHEGYDGERLGRSIHQLYAEETKRTGQAPRRVEILGGPDAAVSALSIAARLRRPSLIVGVDDQSWSSVAVRVSSGLHDFLLTGEIQPLTGRDYWGQLAGLVSSSGIDLEAIGRLVVCSFDVATSATIACRLHGWVPALESPIREVALGGVLAPLASFAAALSRACRDPASPVVWLADGYGAVVRAKDRSVDSEDDDTVCLGRWFS